MSYLSKEELEALQSSGLNKEVPFLISGVSHTPFSISRYSGGCKFNGFKFTYNPKADELVRDDVLKWVRRYRSKLKKD
jgi:hypothetical protein